MKQARKAIWIVTAFVTTMNWSVVEAASEILVREKVVVTRSVVRLGDVADVTCENDADAKRLAALPLMPAPSAEGPRYLRKREIEDLLAAHGIDGSGVVIGGAQQVSIASANANVATEEPLRDGAANRVNRHATVLAGHTEATEPKSTLDAESAATLTDGVCALITNHLATKTANAPKCTVSCEVAERNLSLLMTATSRPTCTGGLAPWTGRQRFEIAFKTAAGAAKFSVYADIIPPAVPVVVAMRAIQRGSVFTAADFEVQEIQHSPRSNERRVAVDSIESLIGMEARQPIAVGSIVFTDSVQSPILVKRGELITISSQGNGFRVKTTVRALHDCSKGDLVQVESLETKERFDARVVGPREADIAAVTTPAATTVRTPGDATRR